MKQYLNLLGRALINGKAKADRTGTGTQSVFGHQMRFDLSEGFPLVTTKKIHLKSVIEELLWMLSGSTNIKPLQDKGVTIWNEWADDQGNLGPVYGKQWRDFHGSIIYNGADQISNALHLLKTDPDSRRIVVSAWNPFDQPQMALAPCHCLFQFYTEELSLGERIRIAKDKSPWCHIYLDVEAVMHCALDKIEVPRRKLSCQLYQRSADIFLGVPFNIASYALLTHMMAQQGGMEVGEFIWTGGDCHLYRNHIEQANLQLSRNPLQMPTLRIARRPDSLFDYRFEDFEIVGYECHPPIHAEVAV